MQIGESFSREGGRGVAATMQLVWTQVLLEENVALEAFPRRRIMSWEHHGHYVVLYSILFQLDSGDWMLAYILVPEVTT